jgi:hypothetical protein
MLERNVSMWNPFARKSEPQAPQFPPFPESLDDVYSLLAPYMKDERPMDFFFEFYIMEVIGALPAQSIAALDAFSAEHGDIFATGDWRAEVRTSLNLSDTIDVAILDLWYRNSDTVREQGDKYHPWHFAINFADEYFADDSQVDVWADGALEAAKARIARHQQ